MRVNGNSPPIFRRDYVTVCAECRVAREEWKRLQSELRAEKKRRLREERIVKGTEEEEGGIVDKGKRKAREEEPEEESKDKAKNDSPKGGV